MYIILFYNHNFFNKNIKLEHYGHNSVFNDYLSKLFLGFHFWTFLKMSIFQNLFNFIIQYYLTENTTYILIYFLLPIMGIKNIDYYLYFLQVTNKFICI